VRGGGGGGGRSDAEEVTGLRWVWMSKAKLNGCAGMEEEKGGLKGKG